MTPPLLDRGRLTLLTAAQLGTAQLAHRVRLRSQRFVVGHLPVGWEAVLRRQVGPVPGWPADFLPIDAQLSEGYPSPEDNAAGRFNFLNQERQLGTPPSWAQPDAPQLWRYHLHYFEWAWSLANHPDRTWARAQFARLWSSWKSASPLGRGEAWSTYVVSLRLWVLCGVYDALCEPGGEGQWRSQLDLHARFLRAQLEHDVGGNHLLKNLKALIGAGVFLGQDDLVETGSRHLRRQLRIQVLADGGHFELSPSYHCQVLGDLIDLHGLLTAANQQQPTTSKLATAIEGMQTWLGAMLMPDGDVPLFNDCTLVGQPRIQLLGPIAPSPSALTVLKPSGYVIIKPDARIHLVADVGPPCPKELPAHAHADCLSFELAVDGRRILVNSGTSTYEPSARRQFERSTAAHNTIEVDSADQTEVWGTFRAAHLAQARLEVAGADKDGVTVRASHDGYTRLADSPRHTRTWHVRPASLDIHDDITGENGVGVHRSQLRIHVAPGVESAVVSDGSYRLGPILLEISGCPSVMTETEVASDFGPRKVTRLLAGIVSGTLPHVMQTRVSLASGTPPGPVPAVGG